MVRILAVSVLLVGTVAFAQTGDVPPAPTSAEHPPAALPSAPGEILIPQYPPGVAPPTEGPVQLDPAAYAQWRKEKLSFAAGSSVILQGLDATPVDRVDFYRLVGRPDLAARQEDGRRRQVWFITGGILVTLAGLVGGIALANSNDAPIVYETSNPDYIQICRGPPCGQIQTHTWQTTTGTLLAIAGAIGGGVLISLGLVAGNPVTTVAEDQTLVGEYNDLLLQRLSSTKKSSAPAPSPVPSLGFQLGPGGGMLQAGWRF